MSTVEGENGRNTDRARRLAAGAVSLVAGTMLAAWLTDLQIATRTDNLAPMSPLACVGFLPAAGFVQGAPVIVYRPQEQ